jgi:hypothetical protein
MSAQILRPGETVHVVTRRLFPEEIRRHFLGTCTAVEGTLARVEGHAFVFDSRRNEYERRPELRTRLFALADAGLIVNILPSSVEIDALSYRVLDGHLVLTDGRDFRLDINEFSGSR